MSTSKLQPEEYLKDRVDDQIGWYNRKSGTLKKRYRVMKILTIAFGAMVPVSIALNDTFGGFGNQLAALLGAAIAALEGIAGILKDKETYLMYRAAAEGLIREKMRFTTGAGAYSDANTAFARFVENCETIMGSENTGWMQLFQQKKEDEG